MHDSSPQLSVVIPTLNEAQTLPTLLQMLTEQQQINLEVIVADGDSSDASREIAERLGARCIASEAGRGRQMNRGAAIATSPLLLFLHADSTLTSPTQLADAVAALQCASEKLQTTRVAGHFRLRFLRNLPGHDLAYRYYEEKSALNRPECTNGDQGLLLPRRFFEELGGYDESLWFLEDQRLAESIRRSGHWITLPGTLATSARRFETEGLGRRLLLSAMIMNFHAMGLDEFFHRVREVYRQQDRTGRLVMTPVFEAIDQMQQAADRTVRIKRWLATGRYVQGHLWQAFFLLDLLAHSRRRLCLALHDRVIRPITDFFPFHLLSTGVIRLFYLGCRRYFRWRER